MPETVRTYTTEHGTVYTQKIITDEAGKNTSESWMKGPKALREGVYLSPKHADKAKSYFNKHLTSKKDKGEVEAFALKMIEDLKKLPYSQAGGRIVFFDDKLYITSAVKKVFPEFDGFSDKDIEETLSVPDDKKSGSELEDSLAGDLAMSSDQNYHPPQTQKSYNQPLLSQIKQDSKGTLKPQTKPAEKKGILSKLSPFSIFKKPVSKKKKK